MLRALYCYCNDVFTCFYLSNDITMNDDDVFRLKYVEIDSVYVIDIPLNRAGQYN